MIIKILNFIICFSAFACMLKYGIIRGNQKCIIRSSMLYLAVILIYSLFVDNVIILTALAGIFVIYCGLMNTLKAGSGYINFYIERQYVLVLFITICCFIWGQGIKGSYDDQLTVREALFVGFSYNGYVVCLMFFLRFGYFGNLIEDIFKNTQQKKKEQQNEINESLMVASEET